MLQHIWALLSKYSLCRQELPGSGTYGVSATWKGEGQSSARPHLTPRSPSCAHKRLALSLLGLRGRMDKGHWDFSLWVGAWWR